MSDSAGESGGDEPTCRTCGDRISDTDLRRVVTRVEDEQAVYLHFCADGCFDTWRSSDRSEG